MVPYQLAILAAGLNNRTHPTSGNTLAVSKNDNRDQHISILIVLHLHIINTHNTHNNYKYTWYPNASIPTVDTQEYKCAQGVRQFADRDGWGRGRRVGELSSKSSRFVFTTGWRHCPWQPPGTHYWQWLILRLESNTDRCRICTPTGWRCWIPPSSPSWQHPGTRYWQCLILRLKSNYHWKRAQSLATSPGSNAHHVGQLDVRTRR